jgi:hypothetical protein
MIRSMSDTLLAAIVGAVAGIITGSIGSLFAPWANWRVEQRKQRLLYRRELIVKWRAMLAELRTGLQDTIRKVGDLDYADNDMEHLTFRYRLENHPDYPTFRPYITLEASKEINEVAYEVWNHQVWAALNRIELIIYQVEKKWKLV